MFGAVLGQAVYVQISRASALSNDPANPRIYEAAKLYQRGEIVGPRGLVYARSVPTNSTNSPRRRVYPFGSLLSQAMGYQSWYYGTAGLEYQYDNYLIS